MKITSWYKNGSSDAFHKFCIQSRKKLVSVELIRGSEIVKGILYSHRVKPFEAAGVFILLTSVALHPAFYALTDIESLHYLAPASLIQSSSVISSALSIAPDGLTYLL